MVFMTIVKAWQSSVICFGGLNLSTASWRLVHGTSHNNNLQVPTLQRHQAGHWDTGSTSKFLSREGYLSVSRIYTSNLLDFQFKL